MENRSDPFLLPGSKETGDVNFLGMPTYETTGAWSYSYIETGEPPFEDGATYTYPPIAVNPTPVGPDPLPGPDPFTITFDLGGDALARLLAFSIDVGNQVQAAFTTVYDVFADGTASDFVVGFAAGFVNTVAIPLPYVEPWQPEPLYGHVDAFNYGQVAGVVAGVATSITVGGVASGVLHAGVVLTKAAWLYEVASTVGGVVTSAFHVHNGKFGLVDALNLALPAAFGVGRLARAVRAPSSCLAGQIEKVYHYTTAEGALGIKQAGQLGFEGRITYLTPNGALSGIQAEIELAFPAGRQITHVVEIAVDMLDESLILLKRRVTANILGRGGGGVEILYNGVIPADLLRIITL
jgi:hypothetical protein